MKLEENVRKILEKIKAMSDKEKKFNIAVICLIGVAMVFASNFFQGAVAPTGTSAEENLTTGVVQNVNSENISNYQGALQNDLKNILGQIEGVGNVDVMITFSNAEKKEIAYNTQQSNNTTTENDNEGGKRVIEESTMGNNAIMVNKGGSNEPLIITESYPVIKGVIVVADGVSNSSIKYELLKCIEKALDLPAHKIMIYQRKK